MTSSRTSGILLHPTSLPSPFGIGDFGPDAYRFADFLAASGQRCWQMLPLGPTDDGPSPYSTTSAFAGNIDLISPTLLAREGLLESKDCAALPAVSQTKVHFAPAKSYKRELLEKAFQTVIRHKRLRYNSFTVLRGFETFCAQNSFWLDGYADYVALKKVFGGAPWTGWPVAVRNRGFDSRLQRKLAPIIKREKFFQFLFFEQWRQLKEYCNGLGIQLIGDMPFFVAHESADVFLQPWNFKLDAEGHPTVVAGVPPDYFSPTGQYWGNPIYRWSDSTRFFSWWRERFDFMARMFDRVRIDHFRGFEACWEIPASDKTAANGSWVKSNGDQLFTGLKNIRTSRFSDFYSVIAEDLGVITPEVDELREGLGSPGMRVMQFGFSGDRENLHLPHNYPSNVVAYTGTHDNNTTVGWFRDLECPAPDDQRTADERKREKEFCLEYLKSDGTEINWDFIDAVLASNANTAITPLQDVLGLGTEARMNLPNTVAGNWEWRFQRDDLRDELAARLRELTERHGRGKEPQ